MSDATCRVQNRTNEEMAARREYGIPRRKGHVNYGGAYRRVTEYNTEISDFCNFVTLSMDIQKEMFHKNVEPLLDCMYVEFLQDYFYRKWKGYVLPYFELPLSNPKRMELYNQTALDSGHPEYMVDKNGKPLKIHNPEPAKNDADVLNIEDKKAKSETEAGTVDVLDKDGKVVAENVGSAKDKPKQESKEAKCDEHAVIHVEPTPEHKEAAAGDKEEKKGLEQAAFFHEVGPRGNCWVDEERGKEYAKNNKSFTKRYPGLQKLVDLCKANGFLVKFYDIHGLVRADVYEKGSLRYYRLLNIDPAKIRNQYSILAGGMENGVLAHPLDAVTASFDEPYFADIVIGSPTKEMLDDAAAKFSVNYPFYKYINYNAFPNDAIAIAAANTYTFCNRMLQAGLSIRFKVTKYNDANDFTMKVIKQPGLGYYVDNDPWLGLEVHVRAGNGVVVTQVFGEKAEAFIKLIGDDVLCSEKVTEKEINKMIKEPVVETETVATQENTEPKKKRTVEIPVGRQ